MGHTTDHGTSSRHCTLYVPLTALRNAVQQPTAKKVCHYTIYVSVFALNIVDTTVRTYITNGANVLPFMAFIYLSVGLK